MLNKDDLELQQIYRKHENENTVFIRIGAHSQYNNWRVKNKKGKYFGPFPSSPQLLYFLSKV